MIDRFSEEIERYGTVLRDLLPYLQKILLVFQHEICFCTA